MIVKAVLAGAVFLGAAGNVPVADLTSPANMTVAMLAAPDDSIDFVLSWSADTVGHVVMLSEDGKQSVQSGTILLDTTVTSYTFRVGPVPSTSSTSYIVGVQARTANGMLSDWSHVYIVRSGSSYIPPFGTTSTILKLNFPASAFAIADSYVVFVTEYDITGATLATIPLMTIRSVADSSMLLPGFIKGNRYQFSLKAYLGPLSSPVVNIGHLQFERQ